MSDAQTQLPRYRCHKEVHAARIIDVSLSDAPEAVLLLDLDPGRASVVVDVDYMKKHQPRIGGYFVVYEDGYRSFSPASAFEGGYTRVQS